MSTYQPPKKHWKQWSEGEKQAYYTEIIRLWRETLTFSTITDRLGVGVPRIKKVLEAAGIDWRAGLAQRVTGVEVGSVVPTPVPPPEPEADHDPESDALPSTYTEEGDKASVDTVVGREIRTLEDALAHAEVDTTVWRVKKWSCTAWQVGMKLRRFDERGKVVTESPHTRNLWRLHMELERILPKPLHDATEAIFRRMNEFSPKYPKVTPRIRPADPHMLEIDVNDLHMAKLCWEPETGHNYDLRIAERMFRNAVEDLVNKAAGYAIERITLPIGNDFFHFDTLNSTTTAGTFQDSDSRFAKMIEVGEMAVVNAIEFLTSIAPVHVVWVPGNHDRLASYHLARTLAAWFRHSENVTVDHSPKVRKYVQYGCNLIGLTHGHLEKHNSLPTIMATEMPEAWAKSTYRAWRIGHLHQSKVSMSTPVASHDGVEVRILRSLAGTDAWHFAAGFIGNARAAESVLLSHRDGYAGHFVANARE